MRHPCVIALVLATAACTSATSSAPPAAKPATQTIRGDAGSLTINATSTADVSRLPYTVDAVWRILPSVMDSVGITVTSVDQARKSIGNPGYKIRGRLGKVALSKYLDCGNGTTQVGANADSYDVFLSVMTGVTSAGAGGATLTTLVDAQARPVIVSQAYSRCSSKGGIEIRIAELVQARLSR